MHRCLLVAIPVLASLAACTPLVPASTTADAPRAVVFFTRDSALLDETARQN